MNENPPVARVPRSKRATLMHFGGADDSDNEESLISRVQHCLSTSSKDFTPDLTWSPPSNGSVWLPSLDEPWRSSPAPSTGTHTPQSSSRSNSSDSLHSMDSTNPSSLCSPTESVMSDLEPVSSGSDSEGESDPKLLSLPIKVAAFALALLPIPTSFFTAHIRQPPPLRVEHARDPKTYAPCHRSASSSTLSPKGSFSNLTGSLHMTKRAKKVSFDKVIVVTSPRESDGEGSDTT